MTVETENYQIFTGVFNNLATHYIYRILLNKKLQTLSTWKEAKMEKLLL